MDAVPISRIVLQWRSNLNTLFWHPNSRLLRTADGSKSSPKTVGGARRMQGNHPRSAYCAIRLQSSLLAECPSALSSLPHPLRSQDHWLFSSPGASLRMPWRRSWARPPLGSPTSVRRQSLGQDPRASEQDELQRRRGEQGQARLQLRSGEQALLLPTPDANRNQLGEAASGCAHGAL